MKFSFQDSLVREPVQGVVLTLEEIFLCKVVLQQQGNAMKQD